MRSESLLSVWLKHARVSRHSSFGFCRNDRCIRFSIFRTLALGSVLHKPEVRCVCVCWGAKQRASPTACNVYILWYVWMRVYDAVCVCMFVFMSVCNCTACTNSINNWPHIYNNLLFEWPRMMIIIIHVASSLLGWSTLYRWSGFAKPGCELRSHIAHTLRCQQTTRGRNNATIPGTAHLSHIGPPTVTAGCWCRSCGWVTSGSYSRRIPCSGWRKISERRRTPTGRWCARSRRSSSRRVSDAAVPFCALARSTSVPRGVGVCRD